MVCATAATVATSAGQGRDARTIVLRWGRRKTGIAKHEGVRCGQGRSMKRRWGCDTTSLHGPRRPILVTSGHLHMCSLLDPVSSPLPPSRAGGRIAASPGRGWRRSALDCGGVSTRCTRRSLLRSARRGVQLRAVPIQERRDAAREQRQGALILPWQKMGVGEPGCWRRLSPARGCGSHARRGHVLWGNCSIAQRAVRVRRDGSARPRARAVDLCICGHALNTRCMLVRRGGRQVCSAPPLLVALS